jgi:hypothetical protein
MSRPSCKPTALQACRPAGDPCITLAPQNTAAAVKLLCYHRIYSSLFASRMCRRGEGGVDAEHVGRGGATVVRAVPS